jgi:hypothetical protein
MAKIPIAFFILLDLKKGALVAFCSLQRASGYY